MDEATLHLAELLMENMRDLTIRSRRSDIVIGGGITSPDDSSRLIQADRLVPQIACHQQAIKLGVEIRVAKRDLGIDQVVRRIETRVVKIAANIEMRFSGCILWNGVNVSERQRTACMRQRCADWHPTITKQLRESKILS